MSLLDELQRMYGLQQPEEPDPVQQMASVEPPPPPELDAATLSATTADMSQPETGSSQNLGHPDVLSFIKELDQSGRLTGGKTEAPKGMAATSATYKTEEGGPSAAERAQGVAVRGQEQLDNGMVDANRLQQQADELEQRAARLRQDAEIQDEERKKQEAENAKRQERLRSQQAELAGQADEPINPSRYYQNMSAFAKLTSLASAAMYGYIGGQGQPPIVETLMQNAKMDVEAQMANNRAAGARRDALIEQYERQYGDTTLVAKRLEADKLLTLSKAVQAEGLSAKSAEAKGAAEDLVSKLQNHVGTLHQEIQEATYGKPVEVSTTYNALKPKGGADMAAQLKRAAELNKSLSEAGATPEERASMLKAANLPVISGKTMAEQKLDADRTEADRKAQELNPTEKQKLIEKVDGLANASHGFEELDKIAKIKRDANGNVIKKDDDSIVQGTPGMRQYIDNAAGSLPFGMGKGLKESLATNDPEDLKALRRAVGKITAGMAHAESGAGVAEDEMVRYEKRMPLDGAEGFERGSAEMFREQKQKYNNLVGQYGKEAVDEMLRKRGIDPSAYGSR
jgi:hypothetical protein